VGNGAVASIVGVDGHLVLQQFVGVDTLELVLTGGLSPCEAAQAVGSLAEGECSQGVCPPVSRA